MLTIFPNTPHPLYHSHTRSPHPSPATFHPPTLASFSNPQPHTRIGRASRTLYFTVNENRACCSRFVLVLKATANKQHKDRQAVLSRFVFVKRMSIKQACPDDRKGRHQRIKKQRRYDRCLHTPHTSHTLLIHTHAPHTNPTFAEGPVIFHFKVLSLPEMLRAFHGKGDPEGQCPTIGPHHFSCSPALAACIMLMKLR